MARIQLSGTQIPTLSKLNVDGEFTLDAASGTTGQILISQGSGNTPAWASSLSALTGLSSAATIALPISTTGGSGAVGLLSLTGGNTSSTIQNGGAITITGGNATNTTVVNSGGSITIKAGNGNSNQGAGGNVDIDAGTGSVANGNGFVNIGTGSGSDGVTIGKSGGQITIDGTLTAVPTFPSQTANTFFAAPTTTGTPTFRRIQSSDMSTLNSPSTSGQVLQYAPAGNGISWTSTPALLVGGGTMTGQLNLAAGTTSLTPLRLTAGTNLTTPIYGAVEASTDAIYLTDNPGSTSTGAGRGRIPLQQTVFAQADSAASINTTVSAFASTYDVLSVLEPAKLYRFRAKYYSALTYSGSNSSVSILFAFSNAPTAIRYSFKTYPQVAGTGTTQQGASAVTTATAIVPSQSTSGAWVTEIDGYFKTHATLTSTFTPQFAGNASFSTSTVIQSGSYIEIEKLGSSSTAIISGNWA
jgi:hypothetical protein